MKPAPATTGEAAWDTYRLTHTRHDAFCKQEASAKIRSRYSFDALLRAVAQAKADSMQCTPAGAAETVIPDGGSMAAAMILISSSLQLKRQF